jgi:outer membrane protein OmpA-like peptidoglycan-associated protein
LGGHADDVGSSDDNLLLSAARVESVRRALLEWGAQPDAWDTRAFGDTAPMARGRDEKARAENRCVTVDWTGAPAPEGPDLGFTLREP